MSFVLAGSEEQPLIVEKQGAGRLYFRLAMNYSPQSLELEAVEYGFKVSRTYTAMEDPEDVKQDDQGVWQVKLGCRVRVTLEMVNTNRNYHVALVDKLPAGLEALNAAIKGTTSEEDRQDSTSGWKRLMSFPKENEQDFCLSFQQNVRDERVEAFAGLLWPGKHVYSYVARATTAGSFVIPPAKAEEMYAPDIFGRTKTEHMVIHNI